MQAVFRAVAAGGTLVMDAQLGRDSVDGPVLGVMQTHDLRFERARDHCSPPCSRAAAQAAESREGGQDLPTKMAALRRRKRVIKVCSQFNVGTVGIVHLGRDRGSGERDCGSDGDERGTLMRHFLLLPCAPGALAGGVLAGPAIAMLVTLTGATHGLASAHLGARPRAVQVAVITMSADLYLAMTAFTRIQPMGLWTLRHAHSTRDWTTPCDTRIKAARMRLFRRRRVEGPGF